MEIIKTLRSDLKTALSMLEDIKERIDSAESKLKAVKETEHGEWPKLSNKYYYIDSTGNVVKATYYNYEYDNFRKDVYNMFRTKEEATEALHKMCIYYDAYTRLTKFAEEYNGDWIPNITDHAQDKYYLAANVLDHNVVVSVLFNQGVLNSLPIFKDASFVGPLLKVVSKDEIKLLLNMA